MVAIAASITVSHTEQAGSPSERYDDEGRFVASRRLRCSWANRHKLAQQLRGGIRNGTQYLPHLYPHFESAWCTSVQIAPWHDNDVQEGDDTREASYDYAELTVQYETPEIDTSTYTSEDVDIAKEFITLPGEELYWQAISASGQGEPIGEGASPGLIVSMLSWTFTHYWLTTLPIATKSLAGHVNSTTVTSPTLGLTFAPETLLYDGLRVGKQRSADGEEKLTAALRFLHRETGWNKAMNPRTGEWSNYYRYGEATVYKPYPASSFTPLINLTTT